MKYTIPFLFLLSMMVALALEAGATDPCEKWLETKDSQEWICDPVCMQIGEYWKFLCMLEKLKDDTTFQGIIYQAYNNHVDRLDSLELEWWKNATYIGIIGDSLYLRDSREEPTDSSGIEQHWKWEDDLKNKEE